MAFAPDGRVFVTEKGGAIRIIKNGVLLPTPWKILSVDTRCERGLLGIAFDPDFPTPAYVYVYYTTGPNAKRYPGIPLNRVSRLSGRGDVATTKERILLEITPQDPEKACHNGGDLHFGPDGKLYIATGTYLGSLAPKLDNLRGKILRINKDGSIPPDNPYADDPRARGEIWARGLRNPWRFTFRPANNSMIIADVGAESWEEIDVGIGGAHYGWPKYEGPCPRANLQCTPDPGKYPSEFKYPIHFYPHPPSGHAAVIGGEFVSGGKYPPEYQGRYFYADFESGWVRVLTLDARDRVIADDPFEMDFFGVVDMATGPDGNIHLVNIIDGTISKYVYSP